MYHAIVRAKLRSVFDALNVENYQPVLTSLAPRFEHAFPGDHALGGTRRTMEATRRWYERLPRVLPKVQFVVDRIVVSGWPWRTVGYVEWRDSGHTLDGEPFRNQGVHVITLAWGKVTSVMVYCDTLKLKEVLLRNAAHGEAEAAAAPIDET